MKPATLCRKSPGNWIAKVVQNQRLSERYYLLVLSRPEAFPDPAPGNFLHIKIPEGSRFFLRRPISILYCTSSEIALLILERGEGTGILRRSRPGEIIEFMGPLGNSFPVFEDKKILAVGGGVGLAPLYFYAVKSSKQTQIDLLYGARTIDDLFMEHLDMKSLCPNLSTDDGSYGFKGSAVELARLALIDESKDILFACGPLPMLRSAAKLAADRNMAYYISLENRMACGIGVCRSCVVEIRLGDKNVNMTVCKDGPVFDGSRILWEKLPEP